MGKEMMYFSSTIVGRGVQVKAFVEKMAELPGLVMGNFPPGLGHQIGSQQNQD